MTNKIKRKLIATEEEITTDIAYDPKRDLYIYRIILGEAHPIMDYLEMHVPEENLLKLVMLINSIVLEKRRVFPKK